MQRTPINAATSRSGRSLIAVILIGMLVFGSVRLIGWDKLKHFLLLGDPEVTEAALSNMIENVRAGEPVTEAITAFCLEIIDHGSAA